MFCQSSILTFCSRYSYFSCRCFWFRDVNCSVLIGSFVVDIVVVPVTYVAGSSFVNVRCSVVSGGFVVTLSVDVVISFVDINCSVGLSEDIISTVDNNCPVVFCNFVVEEAISSVNVVISSVDVNFSIVSGKTVVDLIVPSVDVFGLSVVISVVNISSVDAAVLSVNVIFSFGFDDNDDDDNVDVVISYFICGY